MVKIRLKRLGRKKRPFYRIVVMDIRSRATGAPLAELGYYNPLSRELKLDKQSAQDWIKKGAIATDTAKRLIEKAPETGELIVLEKVRKERLSKKQAELLKQQEEAKKAAEAEAAKAAEEAKAVAEAEKAAEAVAQEAPAAEEAPAEEAAPQAE